MIEFIGIDADDTLWDEASRFTAAESRFVQTVEGWTGRSGIKSDLRAYHFARLDSAAFGPWGYREVLHGYIKQCLPASMSERAEEMANDVCSAIISEPFTPLPGVVDVLDELRTVAKLSLVTKGDEQTQLQKLESSGLDWAFHDVIIVKEKDAALYRRIFGPVRGSSPHAAMIGNSLKSDVIPAIEAGLFGIFVPHFHEAPLEVALRPEGHELFREFENLQAAANWIRSYRAPTEL
jgi:putative hydrolase of the HAD superfamily